MDLITFQVAATNPQLNALSTSNPTRLRQIITAASELIELHCHRTFALTAQTEYRNGGIYIGQPMQLRNYPVTGVSRIAAYPQTAIQIVNNDTITNQRATVATDASANVILTRVASGVTTTVTSLAATNVTIQGLANAINAIGSGWVATIQSNSVTTNFNLWPQSDLRPLQGAATAFLNGLWLEVYTEDYQPMNSWNGYETGGGGDGDSWPGNYNSWRMEQDRGLLWGRFPRGNQNIRIDYTAGYAVIPHAVQEACIRMCQTLYQADAADDNIKAEKIGDYAVTFNAWENLPSKVRALLSRYVIHSNVFSNG